jgi:hypothetical protein
MDTGSPAGTYPAAATEDTGVLTVVETDFEAIYDVPFITVNKVGGKFLAEVFCSDDERVNEARIQEALDVGHMHGVHAFARVWGEYNNVRIHFTATGGGE